jgi:hypothetical protein
VCVLFRSTIASHVHSLKNEKIRRERGPSVSAVDFHFPWQHSLFDPSVAFQIFSTDGSAIARETRSCSDY